MRFHELVFWSITKQYASVNPHVLYAIGLSTLRFEAEAQTRRQIFHVADDSISTLWSSRSSDSMTLA